MKKAIVPFCILIIICLVIFLYFNRFSNYGIIEVDGYALNDNTMYDNLVDYDKNKKVSYEIVSYNQIIYESNSNYYVGEREKKSIKIDYPIISKDKSTLFIASNLGEIITSNFDNERAYSNTMIVHKKLYNTSDYEQATNDDYYFLLLDNGIYVNLSDISIKLYNEEIVIPINSFIRFNETSLNYYYIVNDEFKYLSYPVIDKSSAVNIDKFSGTYIELLDKLSLITKKSSEEEKKEDKKIEEKEPEDEEVVESGEISSEIEESKPEYIKKEEVKKQEKEWEAPEITINSTYAKIYTYRGIISIKDSSNALTKMPTFEFRLNDSVFLRKTVNTSGSFIISGFLPNTKYDVVAYYEYVDEAGTKRQKKIKFNDLDYSDEFTTLDISNLNTLDFNIRNVSSTINSFYIDELSLTNSNDDEVLYGIKSVFIDVNENTFTFTSSQIKELSNLIKFSYSSAEILNSNTNYKASFRVLDTAGNELKLSNNTFSFRTKQCAPKSTLSIKTTKNFTKADLSINIDNFDNVNVSDYKYIIYDSNGNEFSYSKVYDSVEKYTITGLDTAKKYTVKLFCNYTTNENYYYDNVEIGYIEFVSYDIEKLGNIPFTVSFNKSQENYITSSSASLFLAYASYSADDPLYDLINDELTVNIINCEDNSVVVTYKLNKYDFINGLVLDVPNDDSFKLLSDTKYTIGINAIVTSGNRNIEIKTTVNGNGFSFSTLKLEPYVTLSNIYIASGYIDFDAYVIDPNSSILDSEERIAETVNLEIYDSSKNKIYSEPIKITHSDNAEELITNRININSLNKDETFSFEFKALNFYDNFNAETNKVLDGSTEFSLVGLESYLEIKDMIKTSNYKLETETNLFDLSDVTRWKSVYQSSYNRGEVISSRVEENTLTLSADNGYRVYSYYLPELVGKDVVLSYQVKRGNENTSTTVCIKNAVSDTNSGCISGTNYTNTEFGDRESITFKLNSSGYISFYIGETNNNSSITSLVFKDFQIEVGTTASDYKKYNSSGFVGNFKVNGIERISAESENINNVVNQGVYEYFVSLLSDGERIGMYNINLDNVSFSNSGGVTIDNITFEDIVKDKDYSLLFSVYDTSLDRYYDLNAVNFETDAEIRVISTISDFLNMHKNGYYIALNDLDFTGNTSVYSNSFDGILDMQGHSIKLGSNRSYLFNNIGGGGIVRNADIHFYFTNTSAKSSYYGLFYQNYGTVEDCIFTLEESTNVANYSVSLLGWQNYGTIDGFVIHCKANMYGFKAVTLGVNANYGVIKNGYAYADEGIYGIDVSSKIPTTDSSAKDTGVIARSCSSGAIIENIYSTIRVYIGIDPSSKDKGVGSIAYSVSSSTIRNIYVYDSNVSVNEMRDTSKDIMVYSVSNMNYSNLFYISDVVYKGTYAKSQLLTALKNVSFQDNTINGDKKFLTEEAWRLSIFPLLNFDECMPAQEYVNLPNITSEDLRFIGVDKIEYLDDDYNAKITLSFYNPKKYTIKSVLIDDIGLTTMVGKASTNSDNISTAIFKVKNISSYKSFYNLKNVSTTSGSLELNALMEMDLYQNISSLSEIPANSSTNYRLTEDINNITTTSAYILGTFKGKLNGDEHTISNMSVGKCFINDLQGTLKNINFVNFKNTSSSDYASIVCTLDSNGKIDNVYSRDEELIMNGSSTSYVGGLVGKVNSGSIMNSAVNGLKVTTSETTIPRIGGLVGYGTNVVIDASLARNVNFVSNASPNDSVGIGGIIGFFDSGKVTNVYSTGNISSKVQYLGGICGQIKGETATIKGAISAVSIVGQQDYIGGIVGSSATKNNVSKTIALNSLSTTKADYSYFDRTSGTIINRSRNFAWDKQSINNVISNNTNGEVLLTQEDLYNPVIYSSKVGFGIEWALDSNFRTGYIPYLTNSGETVIKGQGYYDGEDKSEKGLSDVRIFYDEVFTLINMEIEENSTIYTPGHSGDSYFIESYVVNLTFSNSHLYDISNVYADGIDISFHNGNGFSKDAKTNTSFVKLDIKPSSDVTKRRYYDSYIINKIKYFDGTENKILDSNIILNLPFYGVIDEASDWENIEQKYYENFIVTKDVDFTSADPNKLTMKSFNNLVGVGENKPVIKNITLNLNKSGISLIDTIVSNFKNIRFENININNTASGSYTGIVKYLNGYMYDMEFDHVTVNAPKMSYVGVISVNQAPRIKTIKVTNMDLTGLSYLGFISLTKSLPIAYISIKGVNITSSQTSSTSYIGAAIGYDYWKSSGTYTTYISGDDITINAKKSNYVGGLFGYASGCNVSISNSSITGYQYVGGIVGNPSKYTNDYNFVYNTTVNGTNYVGGVVGYSTYLYYSLVYNSKINGNYRVGGMAGYSPWETIQVNASIKNIVTGGEQVGGIMGSTNSTTVQYNTVKDTTVKGTKYIGGIIGGLVDNSDNTIRYNTTNATVSATVKYAGGILGYDYNRNTDTTRYRTRIYDNIVAGSIINSADYGAGLVGGVDNIETLFSNQYYRNLIDAQITCETSSCRYIMGNGDYVGSLFERIHVYEGSMVKYGASSTLLPPNASYVAGSNGSIVTKSRLQNTAFYKSGTNNLNLSGFTIDTRTSNLLYYPRPSSTTTFFNNNSIESLYNVINNDMNYLHSEFSIDVVDEYDKKTKITNMSFLPLPSNRDELDGVSFLSMMSSPFYHELPNASVYVSGVDSINIDFDKIDEDCVLIIDGKEYIIDDYTMSFKYDFNSDFSFILSDGIRMRNYNIKVDDIRNTIYTTNLSYYYLKDYNIISNKKINIDNALNIYNGLILLKDKKIYDIDKSIIIDNSFENMSKIDKVCLFKGNYLEQEIETYYLYSLVNNGYINDQLFIKNGNLEIIDSNLSNRKDRIIIDNFNENNYLLYLSNDGVLHSLKDNINYPKNFLNTNIKDINSNILNNTDLLFVLYKDGNYIIFNYKTGTLIDNSNLVNSSFLNYALNKYNNDFNSVDLDKPVSSAYEESKKLVNKIGNSSIDEISKNDIIGKDHIDSNISNTSSNYIIKYNSLKDSYDVIELSSNYSNNETMVKELNDDSVQTKIKKSNSLSSYFNVKVNLQKSNFSDNQISLLFIILSSVISGLIIILGNIVIRNKKIKNNI